MMGAYPAISLWQPWASLLFEPNCKVHETRDWPFPARLSGRTILIHAARRPVSRWDVGDDDPLGRLCADRFGAEWRKVLPFGAFVGTVTLASALQMPSALPIGPNDELCGNWSPGRWAWLMTDCRPLPQPIPAKGQQGFWTAEVTACP